MGEKKKKNRIITDLIKIVEETNINKLISSEELKCPEDQYSDEFIEEIKYLGLIGIFEVNEFMGESFPHIMLIPDGHISYIDFIENYDEIYGIVIDYIKNHENPMINALDISKEFNIPFVFVGTVFKDLERDNLIKLQRALGGLYITKITERGADFFNDN